MKKSLVGLMLGVLFVGFTGLAYADFIGNKDSKMLHTADCSTVKQMKEANKIIFKSAAEALKEGYSACKKCTPSDTVFVASKDGKKFHKADCKTAANIKVDNLVKFASEDEAKKAGYEPCSICLTADKASVVKEAPAKVPAVVPAAAVAVPW